MQSPIAGRDLVSLEEVTSTQDFAMKKVLEGEQIGAVIAKFQFSGRGRFQRNWLSKSGESLLSSTIFWDYPAHPRPHLLGMAMAIAAAGAVHGTLQWPNDVIIAGKKVGGILIEVAPDMKGRKIAIVGVGINLNQSEFPEEISHRATSLLIEHQKNYEPLTLYQEIIRRLTLLPEPLSWEDLQSAWSLFDETPGKKYKMMDGREVTAIGIGSEGQLIASNQGESEIIYAADALFGTY